MLYFLYCGVILAALILIGIVYDTYLAQKKKTEELNLYESTMHTLYFAKVCKRIDDAVSKECSYDSWTDTYRYNGICATKDEEYGVYFSKHRYSAAVPIPLTEKQCEEVYRLLKQKYEQLLKQKDAQYLEDL